MSGLRTKIETLSPSKIHFINECRFRYFQYLSRENNSNGRKFFNKETFIGITIHALIEKYVNEKFSIDEFEDKWTEIYNLKLKEFGVLEREEYVRYHVSYYEIKKRHTKSLLKEYLLDTKAKSEQLISSDIVLGYVDLLEDDRSRKTVKITDFKTGSVCSINHGLLSQIKPEYLLQLKTYGLVFWQRGYSAENITCAIKGLSKKEEVEIIFSDQEYDDHRNFLFELRNNFNDHVKNGSVQILATPSSSGCMYCEFAQDCPPLHDTLQSGIVPFESILIIDHINSEFDDQNFKINISTNGGLNSIHKIPRVEYNRIKEEITEDKKILVLNLYNVSATNIKNWTRFTSYFTLDK